MKCIIKNQLILDYISENSVNDVIDNEKAELVFLAESPNYQEIDKKIPLCGSAGQNLTRSLVKAGIKLDSSQKNTLGFGEWLSIQHASGNYKNIGIINVSNIRLDINTYPTNDKEMSLFIKILKLIKDSCTSTNAKCIKGDLTVSKIKTNLENIIRSKVHNEKDIHDNIKLIYSINLKVGLGCDG